MTNLLLWLIFAEIFGLACGLEIECRKIITAIEGRPKAAEPKTQPFVASSNPGFVNEQAAGNEDESVIVNPKTPALIAWEEEQQINKMNMGRPR